MNIAELCKGSTTDSDSVCLGSNPSSAARKEKPFVNSTKGFFFSNKTVLTITDDIAEAMITVPQMIYASHIIISKKYFISPLDILEKSDIITSLSKRQQKYCGIV